MSVYAFVMLSADAAASPNIRLITFCNFYRVVVIRQNKNQGYYTPEAPSVVATPSTPAWLKKGLVKMKSLDYRFSDQNTAVYPNRKNKSNTTSATNRQQQKIDAAAYRQKILASRSQQQPGGLRSSAGAALEVGEGEEITAALIKGDVTKSPGFKREKQLDEQRKREKKKKENQKAKDDLHGDKNDQKSSFLQCTFNMANILMVSEKELKVTHLELLCFQTKTHFIFYKYIII
jgi:hypothetical protein